MVPIGYIQIELWREPYWADTDFLLLVSQLKKASWGMLNWSICTSLMAGPGDHANLSP